jgi:hypothetical protein
MALTEKWFILSVPVLPPLLSPLMAVAQAVKTLPHILLRRLVGF